MPEAQGTRASGSITAGLYAVYGKITSGGWVGWGRIIERRDWARWSGLSFHGPEEDYCVHKPRSHSGSCPMSCLIWDKLLLHLCSCSSSGGDWLRRSWG